MPYKRYDQASLWGLARSYVEHDDRSYRQTVRPDGRIIGYDVASDSRRTGIDPESPSRAAVEDTARHREKDHDDRCTHHSLVWRMLTWLGGLTVALEEARQMLGSLDPQATYHRFLGAVAPHKFRSPQRQQTLERARQLIELVPDWEARFPEPFFPRFATRSGFP